MAADSLLKSSLKIYAPLDGRRVTITDSLANPAQRLNTLAKLSSPLATRESLLADQISLYPSPTAWDVHINALQELSATVVTMYDLTGRPLLTKQLSNGHFNVVSFPTGGYSVAVSFQGRVVYKRLMRTDL